jgi:alpha-tubulin suppressor-like RCC1 family protein
MTSRSSHQPPGNILGDVKLAQVRGGCEHGLALTTGGQVQAWGDNSVGQLGTGITGGSADIPVPVGFPAGTRITAVRAGCNFSLALTSAGQVLAWGGC